MGVGVCVCGGRVAGKGFGGGEREKVRRPR